MSWNSYIDSVIGHSNGSCDKVVLIGLDGGARWTTEGHENAFKISATEAQKVANVLKSEDSSVFKTSGIYIQDVKYQFLREDWEEGLVLGKKKDHGAVAIQKSATAIVIAHTAEGKSSGDVNAGVAKVIEHLKTSNM